MRRLSVFPLSFQKLGFSLAKRENPASPAGAQEGRHQWFPPSDFLPFPKIIWCKPETGDRCEKENGRGFFLSCRSLTIRNVRYLAATQAVSSPQARYKVNCPQGKRRCPGVQPRRTASDENHIANYHGHHFYIISIERGTLTPPSANYLYHCNRRGAHCAPTVSLNGYGHSSMHRFHSHCGSTLCSPAITHLQMVKNGIMRSCRPAI